MVWARRVHSALSLGCPVVQSGDGHTRNVADFFGREHLTAVGYGACHRGSLTSKGFVNLYARSAVSRHVVTVSRYSHPAVHNFRPWPPTSRAGARLGLLADEACDGAKWLSDTAVQLVQLFRLEHSLGTAQSGM